MYIAVAGGGPDLWHQQSDGIVVMQSPDGHAGNSSHVLDLKRAQSSHTRIVQPRATRGSTRNHLVGRAQARRQVHPAEPRDRSDLGFMADDDCAQTVGRGAKRERAVGVQPRSIGHDRERMCGRTAATTVLRRTTGCAFHRKDNPSAARPADGAPSVGSTLTHRQARYHFGQPSTSASRSHTRSAEARITISLRTTIGGPAAMLAGRAAGRRNG